MPRKSDSIPRKTVQKKLDALSNVLAAATVGDFSKDVKIPKVDDEFTELYVGIQVMLEEIREQKKNLEDLNRQLESKVKRATKGMAETQRIAKLGSWDWNLQTGELKLSDELLRI